MNYDPKEVNRLIDDAGIATHHVDRGASWITEIYRDLIGARNMLRKIGTGATQTVANLAQVGATVIGTVAGPYNVGGTTNKWKGKIDGGSSITVTLTSGATQSTAAVVNDFNVDVNFSAVATAFETTDGTVALVSNSTGLTSEIEVEVVANSCYTIMGFTVGVTEGDMQDWDGHRATLVTKVKEALVEAEAMVMLAANKTGNPEASTYMQLATE